MKIFRSLLCLAGCTLILSGSALAQQRKNVVKTEDYTFTTVKEIPVTPVKNQYRSGTCWCFSTISFIESEIIKANGIKDPEKYPDLSEMFIVRNAYSDRAVKFVRLNGKMNFAAGSDFGDVFEVAKTYGLIPQEAYSGLQYGYDLPVQGELDAVLKGYVEAIVRNPNRKLTPVWHKGFNAVLDAYMGEVPQEFTVGGKKYTPETYRNSLGINLDDYVNLTSYTHHPFYTAFAIEVEDNWRCSPAHNVPLDEYMAIIDNAIENGYTVLWGGDVSEPGFTRDGLAILVDMDALDNAGSDQARWVGEGAEAPAEKPTAKELEVTQESRQLMFDEKTSTDDHGMHLYGIATDQNGTKYYLIKNSWGDAGAYKGIWYMSENFVKAKALNILVNKNAIPKDIRKKMGIK